MINKFELADLLKGCTTVKNKDGQIIVQTIHNMKLVCLTTDDEYSINKFADPMDVLASNKQYGHLHLKNPSGKDMIIPAQIAVMTKQSAQNHGMVKASFVPKLSSKDYRDAGCVQGSQTGYINENKSNTMIRMIPFGAREFIFEKAGQTGSHTNIYAAITRMGEQTGSNNGNYLDQYFAKFDKKLAEFIAHFERPEKCIGVIVFVDDEIVAIDKYPSFEYCEQVWDTLIRDCYGAIAIAEEKKNKKGDNLFTKILKKTDQKNKENTADYLLRVLGKVKTKITDDVTDKINDLLNVDFNGRLDESSDKYKSHILSHDGYVGQVISEGNFNYLVSIVKRESFNPEKIKKASEMMQKAKSQRKFKL